MRIRASDGKVYRLIFPGPSNYQVGDKVDFASDSRTRVTYKELAEITYKEKVDRKGGEVERCSRCVMQDGYFDVDGVIKR